MPTASGAVNGLAKDNSLKGSGATAGLPSDAQPLSARESSL
jgi:hypothetical protein